MYTVSLIFSLKILLKYSMNANIQVVEGEELNIVRQNKLSVTDHKQRLNFFKKN